MNESDTCYSQSGVARKELGAVGMLSTFVGGGNGMTPRFVLPTHLLRI